MVLLSKLVLMRTDGSVEAQRVWVRCDGVEVVVVDIGVVVVVVVDVGGVAFVEVDDEDRR